MVMINIQKKDLFLIGAIFVFLLGVGIVISYGGNQPEVHGHSSGEIGLPDCSDGQILKKQGDDWICIDYEVVDLSNYVTKNNLNNLESIQIIGEIRPHSSCSSNEWGTLKRGKYFSNYGLCSCFPDSSGNWKWQLVQHW